MRLGASRAVPSEDLRGVVADLTGGRGADVTFEVTGLQGPLLVLGDITRMSGKIVLVGYHQGGRREIPLGQWNYQAFQIVNAHFREQATIMRGMHIGMRLLTSGRLSLDGLVTHRFPLDAINDAFALAEEKPPGFVKSTVQVGA
jgi:threonine dehydrogenase-like Zn-dependent dehydrogenase